MKKISILMLEQSLLSGIVSYMDIFKMAGATWDKSTGFELNAFFEVEIVSVDGNPLKYSNYIEINPDRAVSDATDTDLIIVPSSGYDIHTIGSYPNEITDWLKYHHEKRTDIAGGCTGVFVLAEAGILNGKIATTHWGYTDWFRKKYPEIILSPEKILTEDGNIFCAGGGSAGIDLCLYLIERHCGQKVANRCAKALLLERGREIQTPYVITHRKKNHQDSEIQKAQNWVEECFHDNFQINDVASHVGMSLRNFKRRFKNATGDSPLVYIQKLRIEAAKKILENKSAGIEEIACEVGYEDVGFFRKLFARHVGVSPSLYRQKFRKTEEILR